MIPNLLIHHQQFEPMRAVFLCWIVCLMFVGRTSSAQSTFFFANKPVNAPVFDAGGLLLAGTNYFVELYGNSTPSSLTPTLTWNTLERVILSFFTGTNAGYFATGRLMAVIDIPPGGSAWLQVRAWDARLGGTYEDAVALGLGGYGESPLFFADGGDPLRLEAGGLLIGLESFSLRPIVPEPSTSALLAVGGVIMWLVRQRRNASNRDNQS